MNSHYEKIGSQVRCIDDEIPFELPAGWEWCRLGRMSLTLGGFAFASGDIKSSTGIRVIRISDFNESGLLNHKVVRYNGKQPIDENYVINQYDILMAMTGGTVGKSVLLNTIPEILYLNQRVANIRSLFSCPQYLFCVLSAPHIQGIVQTRKNSTNDNISMEDIRNFPVPLPPLSEQYRILAKLEKILPLVDKYGNEQIELEKINSDIKDLLRKSILQEAIQGKLVPQDPNDEPASELLKRIKAEKERLIKDKKIKRDKTESVIFRGDDNKYYEQVGVQTCEIEEDICFPESWCVTRLDAICKLSDGEHRSGQGLCLDTKYLRRREKSFLEGGKFVNKDDAIILVDGENSGEVFISPTAGYMGSTFKQLWISSEMYRPYVLNFILLYKDMLRNSKKGAAIPHLNKDVFKNLIIGIPPLEEQKRISVQIDRAIQMLK